MISSQTVTFVEKFPKELEPYKNLIYVPLDLPDPPEVDQDRLMDFLAMRAQRDEGTQIGSLDSVTLLNSPKLRQYPTYNRDKDTYPWRLIHFLRPDFPQQGQPLFDELANHFPEIAAYVRSLPTEQIYTFSLLNQKPGIDVPLHTDPDIWFGLRFYLVNRSPARLFFRKSLSPSTARLVNIRRQDGEVKEITPWDNLVGVEKIYAGYPRSRFPFHLTCTHAAHGVEAVPQGTESRVTGFVICRVNAQVYRDLLERSLEKYGEYAIWW